MKLPSCLRKDKALIEVPSVRIKNIICPSCRATNNLRWLEEFGTIETTCMFQTVGNEREEEGNMSQDETPKDTGVRAVCKCDYIWKLHRIKRITDLDETVGL